MRDQLNRRCPTVDVSRWRLRRLMIFGLVILLAAELGGCAYVPPSMEAPPAPQPRIQPEVWRAIDERILAASVYAKGESEAYARVAMDEWRDRVRRRTEEVFIPWYSSYWTQQWISTKVAWYQLQYTEGEATPEERLVGYLQEQFQTQVLEPVSGFVDLRAVMEETTNHYRLELKGRVMPLSFEYGIPVDTFNQHLDTLPAIVSATAPPQNASLREVLQAADLSALPAYGTLRMRIYAVNGNADPAVSPDKLDQVASRAVTKLVGTLPLRVGATAASTLVGGFWGLMISAGSAAWSIAEHEQDKQAMEMQLRGNLDAALELMWQDLLEDKRSGVVAVVEHMSEQIETAVAHAQ